MTVRGGYRETVSALHCALLDAGRESRHPLVWLALEVRGVQERDEMNALPLLGIAVSGDQFAARRRWREARDAAEAQAASAE